MTLRHATRSRGLGVILALAIVAAILLTGCSSDEPSKKPASDGPLDFRVSSGGVSVDGPNQPRYAATFGSLLPCLEDDTGTATLEKVTYNYKVDAERSQLWLRMFGAPAFGDTPGSEVAAKSPLVNPLGTPPLFDEPYGSGPRGGHYEAVELPLELSDSCEETGNALDQLHKAKPISDPIPELLVTMWVDGGAYLDSITVDYTADGNDYREKVHWSMVACGSKLHDEDVCGQGA